MMKQQKSMKVRENMQSENAKDIMIYVHVVDCRLLYHPHSKTLLE